MTIELADALQNIDVGPDEDEREDEEETVVGESPAEAAYRRYCNGGCSYAEYIEAASAP